MKKLIFLGKRWSLLESEAPNYEGYGHKKLFLEIDHRKGYTDACLRISAEGDTWLVRGTAKTPKGALRAIERKLSKLSLLTVAESVYFDYGEPRWE